MTSIELLTVVSTVAILVFTLFVCTALFYGILILKRMYAMMDAIEQFLKGITDSVGQFYGRLCTVKDSIDVVSQGVKMLTALYQERSFKKRKLAAKKQKEEQEE